MLVAKLHKLGDRLDRPDRLQPKDAGDVYRLYDVIGPADMAEGVRRLLADDRSSETAAKAIEYGGRLFDSARSVGVELARAALRGTLPEDTVTTPITAYWHVLKEPLT